MKWLMVIRELLRNYGKKLERKNFENSLKSFLIEEITKKRKRNEKSNL